MSAPQTSSGGKQIHNFRILHRDVEKFGETPGCAACTGTLMGRESRQGKQVSIGTAHCSSCRARFRELMMDESEGRARILKSEARSEHARREIE